MSRERVIRAIIYCGGKVLAVRHDSACDEEYWAFPGGAVGKDETPEEACRHRLSEEQDIGLRVLWHLDALEVDLPDHPLTVDVFVAPLEGGCAPDLDDEGRRWLSQDQLLEVDWSTADMKLVTMVGMLWDRLFSEEHL